MCLTVEKKITVQDYVPWFNLGILTPPQWAVQCMYHRYKGTPDGQYIVCTVKVILDSLIALLSLYLRQRS